MKYLSKSPNYRLKIALEGVNGGIDKVSEITKVPRRTWYNLFKDGKDIKSSYLVSLKENFGIDTNEILYGTSEINGTNVNEPPAQYDTSEFASVPFYINVFASAGEGMIAENEESLPILFRNRFIRSTLNSSPKDLVAIKATGDSMTPDINSGDLLIVDTSRNTIRSERPYVLIVGDQVRVKEVRNIGNGMLKLISKNDRYEPEEIPLNECVVYGEVRHIQRTLN